MLTYGDGVSDVDLGALLAFHREHGQARDGHRRPAARRGSAGWASTATAGRGFTEKPQIGEGWINGGFMVLEPGVLDYIDGDATSFEADVARAALGRGPAGRLPARRLLAVHGHAPRRPLPARGLWDSGDAPWVTWA